MEAFETCRDLSATKLGGSKRNICDGGRFDIVTKSGATAITAAVAAVFGVMVAAMF